MNKIKLEHINCPLCNSVHYIAFAEDNGFKAVRCSNCSIIYVNPRPALDSISEAVKTGFHSEVKGGRNVVVRRVSSKVNYYKRILMEMFEDIHDKASPVLWLDIGAGYGEFIEAVEAIAPFGSNILGIEPMQPKAISAQKKGLNVKNIYLSEIKDKYDVVSLINVFSHIPDIKSFINEIEQVLKPNGIFFLETGNIADLKVPSEVPTELDLPDHLIFAGEKQIDQWLTDAGFKIVDIKRIRKDTAINFIKNIVKIILGRNVTLSLPYTSNYRSLLIKAQLSS